MCPMGRKKSESTDVLYVCSINLWGRLAIRIKASHRALKGAILKTILSNTNLKWNNRDMYVFSLQITRNYIDIDSQNYATDLMEFQLKNEWV